VQSNAVLDGIANALQLDEAERTHLFDLARAAQPSPPRQRRTKASGVTGGIQQILDAITDAPAWVRNARHDMLAANRMARALYAPLFADPRRPVNNARFVYLDPAARDFFTDCSEDFRTRWAAHNVRFHRTGRKRLHHPVVGPLELDFEAMEFPAHPGLTLLVYTATAASPAADNLKLLASWAATADQTGDLPTYA
jgi:MmyB-like transcription regulator ligand binding domain